MATMAVGSAKANLMFQFTSTGNSQVDAALVQAGQLWSHVIRDNVTVSVFTDYASLGSEASAGTAAWRLRTEYATLRNQLLVHTTSPDDVIACAQLSAGSCHSFYRNDRDGTPSFDNDRSTNNRTLETTWANARVLGFQLPNNPYDGAIHFNSDCLYDFDRSDGIGANAYDFIGVATHELGHVLGFISNADVEDLYTAPNGPQKAHDANGSLPGLGQEDYPFTILDMFRYKAESNGARDFTLGGTPYFSIDGGATDLAQFSTGYYNGDGFEASHWQNSAALGVMQPTIRPGKLATISPLDLIAIDVIGYAVIPEPSSITALGIGALSLLAYASCASRRCGSCANPADAYSPIEQEPRHSSGWHAV
jgi:hypothetical protein